VSDVQWQPTFEGFEVSETEATLQAVNVVLDDDIQWGDEVELHITAKVTRISYDLDKDKAGFLDQGRRKHHLTPVAVKLVRQDS
jgi:hypothetical protein